MTAWMSPLALVSMALCPPAPTAVATSMKTASEEVERLSSWPELDTEAQKQVDLEVERLRKARTAEMGQSAAAALIGLRKGPAWLAEDHANAARLAQGLSGLPGLEIDASTVQTNIVFCRVTPGGVPVEGAAAALVRRLKEAGVLAVALGGEKVRFVTHRDVSRTQIDRGVETIRSLLP